MKTSVWVEKPLSDLGSIGRGKSRHRPRNEPFLYDGPYPFIQTDDITNSILYVLDYTQTYSEAGLAQSRLWEPDTLCIVNAGVNTGDTAILSFKACFPDSVIGFVADNEKSNVRFIKYFIDSIKTQIRQVTMGATQDNLSISKLLSFRVPTPHVTTQRKIAAILSAYDDLIENNLRRIKILEEMAQNLYREWFVKFRFPGYQNARFVDSPLGRIPEGWEVVTIGELIAEHIGGGWGNDVKDDKHTEPAWVIRGTDIPDARSCYFSKVPPRAFHFT